MKKQTKYVDGYLLVVPKNRVEDYKKMAQEASKMWLEHGALAVRECMGDDMTPKMGNEKPLYFPAIANASTEETVWFSYIEYASKEDRDRINELVYKDMETYQSENPDHAENMPFDMKRMAFGGFTAEVSEE